MRWNNNCRVAFEKIKTYLLPSCFGTPSIQSTSYNVPGVHEISLAYVLEQYDGSGKKEQAIYCLSKKFTDYESRYSSFEKICCDLV